MYKLYIKQKVFKITDHYPVLDESGAEVYQVDQDFKFIGNRVTVTKNDGTKSFVLEKRILTFMPQYDVTFSDGKSFFIKKNFTFFKKEINLFSEDYDLKLIGDFLDLSFDVENHGEFVGHIEKKFLSWGDTYEITVYDKAFEEELLALMIVLDAIKDDEESASSSSSQ